jgi:hypothetical protein
MSKDAREPTGEERAAAATLLTEPEPHSFGLTAVGDRLRGDVPASMRNWAMLADTLGFRACEPILDAVRTGKTGTEIAYAMTTMEQVRADAGAQPGSTRPCRNGPRPSPPASPPMTSPRCTSSPISVAGKAPCWPPSCGPLRDSRRGLLRRRTRKRRRIRPGQRSARLGRPPGHSDPARVPPCEAPWRPRADR